MLKQHARPETLSQAIRYFADPDRALAFVVQMRWPSGVICPLCGGEKPSFLTTRRIFKCRECKKQFSVKVGTIFEDSPLGLDKWLPCVWLIANAKNGVSSHELARSLEVTQKTAWFMLHRVRLAMRAMSFERKLDGEVESDETFIGGKAGNMHAEKRRRGIGQAAMVAVQGMLERKRGDGHSTIRTQVIPNTQAMNLEMTIRANVEEGSDIYTDAATSYRAMAKKSFGVDYNHAAVDHAIKYVDGAVHTNGLENFWSCLKRTIKGTYVSVDPIHLYRYLDEQTYRFNERKKNDLQRFVGVLREVVGRRLTYKELISADMLPATT